jgi:hypothetical protein
MDHTRSTHFQALIVTACAGLLIFFTLMSCIIFSTKKVSYINTEAVGLDQSAEINYETAVQLFAEAFVLNLRNVSPANMDRTLSPWDPQSPTQRFIKYCSPSLRNKLIFLIQDERETLKIDGTQSVRFIIQKDTQVTKYKNTFIAKVDGLEEKMNRSGKIEHSARQFYLRLRPASRTYINLMGIELDDFFVKSEYLP